MYYPFFLVYILTGVVIGALVFIWALKNRQFTDQQRARYLPLEESGQPAAAVPARAGWGLYCIIFLAVAAILSSFALVGYALFFSPHLSQG